MVISRITGVDGAGHPNNNQSMIHSKQIKRKKNYLSFSPPLEPPKIEQSTGFSHNPLSYSPEINSEIIHD